MSLKDKRLRWEEFAAGWGGGLINVGFTYPLHKVMFRQMLHGLPLLHAIRQLNREGFRLLYRGIFPPLLQKTASTSVMFGAYDYYGKVLMGSFPNLNPQVARSVGACLAGFSEATLTSPLERIQTLLQDKHYNTKLNNTYHAVKHVWKSHGVAEFYRGVSMVMFRNSVCNMAFFASKEKAQQMLPHSHNMYTKYLTDFVSGGVIGAAISTTFYPVNVVKTRMQCKLGGSFESPHAVLQTVFNERSRTVSKMFRGVHLNYTRSLLGWGITNASYELLIVNFYKYSGNDRDGV